jgi:multiple antibiotic resistance protein
MYAFVLSFIPLFVAMDPLGVLPLFVSWTAGLSAPERRQILWQALVTATLVGLVFIFVGKGIFVLLGITVADFKIAGGLLLVVISIHDLLHAEKPQRRPSATMGVVPLGTPLIVGPAVLTTLLILNDEHGLAVTAGAFLANILLVGAVFASAKVIMRALGEGGTRGISKVMALLLAAIGVMMIRLGVMEVWLSLR